MSPEHPWVSGEGHTPEHRYRSSIRSGDDDDGGGGGCVGGGLIM